MSPKKNSTYMKWKLQLELKKNSIICMLSLSVFF